MMKKTVMLILMLCLFALSATALTVSSPTIGNAQQDRVGNVSTTFSISNDGNNTLENISLSSSAESKFNIRFTNAPTSIAVGQSKTVTITGDIPLNHNAVDTNFKEAALLIGQITVTGDEINGSKGVSAVGNINMQAVNHMEVDVRAECGDRSKKLDDGDRFDNLKPGTDCNLEIEVENKFPDNDRNNLKIGDIEFDVDIDADVSSNDLDLDLQNDIDRVGADEKDSENADLIIEDDARDQTHEIKFIVRGTDENGALHAQVLEIKFEVQRLTHDIQIRNIGVTPSTVSACQDSSVRTATRILNQGKRNEDEAAVEAIVNELQFEKKVENIELDEDDSTTVAIDVLVPKGTDAGVYRVDINTYFDNVAPSQSASADFTVTACETEEVVVVDDEPTTTVVVDTPVQTTPQQTDTTQPSGARAAPVKSSFGDSTGYVAVLIILIVLIIAVIIGVGMTFMRRK